jgi:hypothetical protein
MQQICFLDSCVPDDGSLEAYRPACFEFGIDVSMAGRIMPNEYHSQVGDLTATDLEAMYLLRELTPNGGCYRLAVEKNH